MTKAHRPWTTAEDESDPFGQLADALQEISGVEQVAVVVEAVTRAAPRRSGGASPTSRTAQPPPPSRTDHRRTEHHPVGRRRPAEAYGGDLPASPRHRRTLQDALRAAAAAGSDTGLTYLRADGSADRQSYRELLDEAQQVLGGLRALSVRPGDAVLFQMGDDRNFLTVLWACVLGGYAPTPLAPAPGYRRDNDVTRKLRAVWELLDRPVIVTDERLSGPVRGLGESWGVPGPRVASAERLARHAADIDWYPAGPDDVALHLLTSGSSGTPKCVRHTHRGLLALVDGFRIANGFTARDISLNWIPLDHVGALVMTHVRDVVLGCRQVHAKLGAALADPLRCLDWAHAYSVTNMWAPNFMFGLINDRVGELADRGWDLSALRHICNGGEAVVAGTAHRFLRLMGRYGLPADAMRPAWGMSETGSAVTFSRLDAADESVGTIVADLSSLTGEVRLVERTGHPGAVMLTQVGPPIPGVRLRIVDDAGALVPEGTIGRVQVAGATMLTDYYRNPAANQLAFTENGWFDTGDLGFLLDGSLTIVGRHNDVVIIRGANYVTFDIESLAERVDGVTPGSVAAGAYRDDTADTDRLALFFVPTDADPAAHELTVARIRAMLLAEIGVHADTVVPLAAQELPRTAKGTIQRARLLAALADGEFAERLPVVTGGPDLTDEPDGALPAWFFEKVWRRAAMRAEPTEPDGDWLLFDLPGADLEQCLYPALAARGGSLIIVRPGPEFGVDADGRIRIRPGEPSDHRRLREIIESSGKRITTVVHGWGLGPVPERPDPGALRESLDTGILSVLLLLQHLSAREKVRMLVLTEDALWTDVLDRPGWANGAVSGLVRTADAEAAAGLVRQVDLSTTDRGRWADQVLREATLAEHAPVVAWRDGQRLVPRLRVAEVTDDLGGSGLVAGGLYLLTGGLGGIGHQLAQYLLSAYQIKLLIVGREPVRARASGTKPERLAELHELGEVRYVALDVADAPALAAAVESAERRWDARLAGVLHLASADIREALRAPERHTVLRSTPEEYLRMYRAKLLGTAAIGQLLEERPDCPLVLFSSVSADLGSASLGAYASANSFLNGFADYWRHTRTRPVRCLGWSMWTDTGMNEDNPVRSAALRRGFRQINPVRGVASLLAALGYDGGSLLIGLDRDNPLVQREFAEDQLTAGRVVVAFTGDPDVDERRLRHAAAEVPGVTADALRFVHVPRIPTDQLGRVNRWRLLAAVANRSGGTRRHAEPTTDTQREVARIWQGVLKVNRVGLDDTFFELGGTSLAASQLVARLNAEVTGEVAIHHLYEHPTVRQLSDLITATPDRCSMSGGAQESRS